MCSQQASICDCCESRLIIVSILKDSPWQTIIMIIIFNDNDVAISTIEPF